MGRTMSRSALIIGHYRDPLYSYLKVVQCDTNKFGFCSNFWENHFCAAVSVPSLKLRLVENEKLP